jgi:N-hydroxyarylamine O-acetyltransferase
MEEPLDLEAYLDRVEYTGSRQLTLDVLRDLHLAHATHIPFENLDVVLGRPIRLDLPGLQAKMVHGRRGGYCFEQNLLFAAALERLGFRLTRLAARVRFRATRLLPRTHMLLAVEAEGRSWLADVGFGGKGLLQPLPLAPGEESRQFAWTYRVAQEPGRLVLQFRQGEAWQDLYAFTMEEQEQVDYELASYYVSTHPESIFTKMRTVQLCAPTHRLVLRNRDFSRDEGGREETHRVEEDEVLDLLSRTFGLSFPPGTRFPFREDPVQASVRASDR